MAGYANEYDGHSPDDSPRKVRKSLAQKLHLIPPGPEPVKHEKTQEYATAVVQALIRESFNALGGEEGVHVAKHMFEAQLVTAAESALSERGKQVSRTSAREAFTGTYDAVEKKYGELAKNVAKNSPWFMKHILLGATCFGVALAVGVLLSVWRFVFFGLGPIFA